MPNIGESYVVDLDALFEYDGGDRLLPEMSFGDTRWWRYLGDDDEGAFCLYTYDTLHGEHTYTIDDSILETIRKNNLAPSCFGRCAADVIAYDESGAYLLRMRTGDGSLYTPNGKYIPDFMLSADEMNACCTRTL